MARAGYFLVMATTELTSSRIEELLGDDAESLLRHECKTFPACELHLPGPDCIDRVFVDTDRPTNVLRNLQWLLASGRVSRDRYLPVPPPGPGHQNSPGAAVRP